MPALIDFDATPPDHSTWGPSCPTIGAFGRTPFCGGAMASEADHSTFFDNMRCATIRMRSPRPSQLLSSRNRRVDHSGRVLGG
jgi:hypothetical protein